MERLGRRSLKAAKTTDKSSSEGVGIMFAPWVSVQRVPFREGATCIEVHTMAVDGLPDLTLGLFYGSQDVEDNLGMCSSIVSVLTNRGRPRIIGGDWKVEIEETETRKRCLGWPAQIMATMEDD